MDFLKNNLIVTLLPLLIAGVKQIADAMLNGEALSDHGKRFLVSTYCELKNWGEHLAKDTETTIDDAGVAAALDLCADTLAEAGVPLPVIPEF